MNILITTGIFPPDVGGPAKFVPLMADNLSKNHVLNIQPINNSLFIEHFNKKDNQQALD